MTNNSAVERFRSIFVSPVLRVRVLPVNSSGFLVSIENPKSFDPHLPLRLSENRKIGNFAKGNFAADIN